MFEVQAQEAEEQDVLGQDLPPEDDDGPIEYKLKLCGLDTKKVIKRTTQMAFRLTEGRGEAFYEIGVHDNGQVIGIEQEEIFETMLVLFHIATQLEATLEVCLVRLGPEGYSIQLRVTKSMPEMIEPELDAFFNGLNFLNARKMYEAGNQPELTADTQSQSIQRRLSCKELEVEAGESQNASLFNQSQMSDIEERHEQEFSTQAEE